MNNKFPLLMSPLTMNNKLSLLTSPLVPEGMVDLMKILSKEVIKEKPPNIYEFAAEIFEKMLIERDGSLNKGYGKFRSYAEYCKCMDKMEQRKLKQPPTCDEVDQIKNTKDVAPEENEIHPNIEIQGVAIQGVERQSKGSVKNVSINPKYKTQTEKVTKSTGTSVKNVKPKPRKLSSKKPSESLIAITEETSADVDDNGSNNESNLHNAAVIIQKAFRKYLSSNNGQHANVDGRLSRLSENAAARIIQKAFKLLVRQLKVSKSNTKKIDVDSIQNLEVVGQQKINEIYSDSFRNKDDEISKQIQPENALDDEKSKQLYLENALDDENSKQIQLEIALDEENSQQIQLENALDEENPKQIQLKNALDDENSKQILLENTLEDENSKQIQLENAQDDENSKQIQLENALDQENSKQIQIKNALGNENSKQLHLEMELDDKNSKQIQLENALEDEHSKQIQLENALEDENSKHIQLKNALNDENAKQIQLDNALDDENSKHLHLENALDDENSKQIQLKNALDKENSKQIQLKNALDDENSKQMQLENALEDENSKHLHLENALDDENSKQIQLKNALDDENSKQIQLKNALDDENSKQIQLENTLEDKNSKHLHLENALDDENAKQIQLENALEDKNSKHLHLENALDDENAKQIQLENALDEENSKQIQLKNTLGDENSKQMQLENALEDENSKHLHLENSLDDENSKQIQLENTLEDEHSKQIQLENALKDENSKQIQLKNALGDENSKQMQLENALGDENSKQIQLKNTLENEHSKQIQLENALEDKNSKHLHLENALDDENAKQIQLENALEDKNTKHLHLENALDDENAKQIQLENALDEKNSKQIQLKNTLGDENSKQMQLENALEDENSKQIQLENALGDENSKQIQLENTLEDEHSKQIQLENALKDENSKQIELENALDEENSKQIQLKNALGDENSKQMQLENALEDENSKHLHLENALDDENSKQIQLKNALDDENSKQIQLENALGDENSKQIQLENTLEDEHSKQIQLENALKDENSKQIQLKNALDDENSKQIQLENALENEISKQIQLETALDDDTARKALDAEQRQLQGTLDDAYVPSEMELEQLANDVTAYDTGIKKVDSKHNQMTEIISNGFTEDTDKMMQVELPNTAFFDTDNHHHHTASEANNITVRTDEITYQIDKEPGTNQLPECETDKATEIEYKPLSENIENISKDVDEIKSIVTQLTENSSNDNVLKADTVSDEVPTQNATGNMSGTDSQIEPEGNPRTYIFVDAVSRSDISPISGEATITQYVDEDHTQLKDTHIVMIKNEQKQEADSFLDIADTEPNPERVLGDTAVLSCMESNKNEITNNVTSPVRLKMELTFNEPPTKNESQLTNESDKTSARVEMESQKNEIPEKTEFAKETIVQSDQNQPIDNVESNPVEVNEQLKPPLLTIKNEEIYVNLDLLQKKLAQSADDETEKSFKLNILEREEILVNQENNQQTENEQHLVVAGDRTFVDSNESTNCKKVKNEQNELEADNMEDKVYFKTTPIESKDEGGNEEYELAETVVLEDMPLIRNLEGEGGEKSEGTLRENNESLGKSYNDNADVVDLKQRITSDGELLKSELKSMAKQKEGTNDADEKLSQGVLENKFLDCTAGKADNTQNDQKNEHNDLIDTSVKPKANKILEDALSTVLAPSEANPNKETKGEPNSQHDNSAVLIEDLTIADNIINSVQTMEKLPKGENDFHGLNMQTGEPKTDESVSKTIIKENKFENVVRESEENDQMANKMDIVTDSEHDNETKGSKDLQKNFVHQLQKSVENENLDVGKSNGGRELMAVLVIQKYVRGYLARRHFNTVKKFQVPLKQIEEDPKNTHLTEHTTNAVLTSEFPSYSNRFLIPKDSFLERESFADDEDYAKTCKELAATSIQKTYRGFRVRRSLQSSNENNFNSSFNNTTPIISKENEENELIRNCLNEESKSMDGYQIKTVEAEAKRVIAEVLSVANDVLPNKACESDTLENSSEKTSGFSEYNLNDVANEESIELKTPETLIVEKPLKSSMSKTNLPRSPNHTLLGQVIQDNIHVEGQMQQKYNHMSFQDTTINKVINPIEEMSDSSDQPDTPRAILINDTKKTVPAQESNSVESKFGNIKSFSYEQLSSDLSDTEDNKRESFNESEIDETSRGERDDLSEVENFDLSSCGEDSLEAMYYSLRKNEIMLDRMQKKVAEQESKNTVIEGTVSENLKVEFPERVTENLHDAIKQVFKSVESSDCDTGKNDEGEDSTTFDLGLDDSSSINDEKEIETSRHIKRSAELNLKNDISSETTNEPVNADLKDIDEDMNETSNAERNLINGTELSTENSQKYNNSCSSTNRLMVKSQSVSEAMMNPMMYAMKRKEAFVDQLHIRPYPIQEYLSEDHDAFPDHLLSDMDLGNVQRKFFASSVSETDSDYMEPSTKLRLMRDDFNISTALDHLSTDSDSTIVSAATKIQAGARGFLTRRRLRRASQGGTSISFEKRYSFGNAAIDKSLEDLIKRQEQINLDDAALKIQQQYRKYQARKKNLKKGSPIREQTIESGSSSSEGNDEANIGIRDVKLAQKKVDDDDHEYNINDQKEVLSTQQVSLNIDEVDAAQSVKSTPVNQRRLTLQRGDAVQRNSRPDSPELTAKQVDPSDIERQNDGKMKDSETGEYNDSMINKQEKKITSNINIQSLLNRGIGPRQRSMPVQIDSELMRIIPKHLRKRVKSAEIRKKKRF